MKAPEIREGSDSPKNIQIDMLEEPHDRFVAA
jgi:hypothetical protein